MTERLYSLDETIFNELTPDSVYWIGYLLGDGNCTNENKIRLCLARQDRDLLEQFRNFVKSSDRPIKDFLCQNKYEQSAFEFRSDAIIEALDCYGLRTLKALRGAPQLRLLKDEFVRDFVRGYFDADGSCFYDGQNKQWLFAEITGYLPMLTVLREILIKHGVIDETKKITKNGKIFRIRFPKEDAKKLFRFIYNGRSHYALARKRKMVEAYFEKLGVKLYDKK